MPINPAIKHLYPNDWSAISYFVRFVRENGFCQNCGCQHGVSVRQLEDGRWYDQSKKIWRDKNGRITFSPDIFEFSDGRSFKVYLAACHIDHDPRINGNQQTYDRVAAFCQKCHLNHDRPFHIRMRRFNRRTKMATGDLFLGGYDNSELIFNY